MTRIRAVDHKGNVAKEWYVEYYVFDCQKGCDVLKRHKKGINTSLNTSKRYEALFKWYDHYVKLLENGWQLNETDKTEISILQKSFVAVVDWVKIKKTPYIRPSTIAKWNTTIKYCAAYFDKYFPTLKFIDVNYDHLKGYVAQMEKSIGAKSFNNEVTNLRAVYNLLQREFPEKIIPNWANKIRKLPVPKGLKHLPFTESQMKQLVEVLEPQHYLFVSFVYYCAIRPRQELRGLKVSDLLDNKLRIPSTTAKNRSNQYVAIPNKLQALINQYEIRNYPADFYIFGNNGVPGERITHNAFFYRRIRKVLDSLGFEANKYDIYSFKHTGVVDLFNSGADIKDIQQHCRHSEVATTDKYLRDLGLIRDNEKVMNFGKL